MCNWPATIVVVVVVGRSALWPCLARGCTMYEYEREHERRNSLPGRTRRPDRADVLPFGQTKPWRWS
uniref:Putative secreted protein n=1 Tax=Anopheles marajoara TaxID=58244 RepID=A0A2M4CG23_9DIPT